MVDLARELSVPVNLDAAQERCYDALRPDDLDPATREVLRPLARALGLAAV
jgi:hypothetical protein